MKPKGKLLLILFLITWAAFAVVTFINHSQNYLVKSYFDSEYFESSRESFLQQLGQYVLEPFDGEEAKKTISVNQEDIDYYRNYNGSTIDSNKTIEEIIRKQREQMIDQYALQEERNRIAFLKEYGDFTYSIENVDTGKTFKNGEMKETDLYSESFGPEIIESSFYLDPYSNDYEWNEAIAPFTVVGKDAQFQGAYSVPKSISKSPSLYQEYQSFKVAKYIFYALWVTGILAIIGLFKFAKPSIELFNRFDKLKEPYLRIPLDVQLVLILVAITASIGLMDALGHTIQSLYSFLNSIDMFIIEPLIYLLVLFIAVSAVIIGAIWTWESINSEEKMKKQVKQAMLYRMADGMKDLFLNRSVGVQAVGILFVAFLTGIGFIGAAVQGQALVPIFILLFFFIALPAFLVFLRYMSYLNRIMKQTQEMAEGRLTSEIKVKGKSIFAKHAANLNDLREGVRTSMSEQAKSERLKTELITNVSHDLRTPLTSIITYTDLLKNPNITEEERTQYIDVLDKKSARLKTLIEDLFEVSKMASGNIEVTKQRLDLTQLMKQAIGEHEEEFAKANFELRITIPEQPVFAYVDGQKM
ncbi:MAG TPA: histidine kinase dimerization/phospho-acceptor domain-containing protein, partial [Ureibacillus sp.]|nr:histidine kinase dimerization/phospho-acceptor domain-containing protein [Ureibacillus sp.]